MRRLLTATLALAITTALAPAAAAQEPAGSFFSLLPVGQGSSPTLGEFTAQQADGTPPARFTNQRAMFEALLPTGPQMADDQLPRFFKPAPLIAPGDAALETPKPGVTIARDGFGVPYVTGATRADVAWGAGFAQAQDRLFFMDVLRHTAQGRLTDLIGPGAGEVNAKADAAQLAVADYTDAELQGMVDDAARTPAGRTLAQELDSYTAGVNAWIAQARGDGAREPAEYALLGKPLRDWRTIDSVSLLGLLNGFYGLGGGGDLKAVKALLAAKAHFGSRGGRRVFEDFRRREDPEAPVVITTRFPFDAPGHPSSKAVALPDKGSVRDEVLLESPEAASTTKATGGSVGRVLTHGLRLRRHASNAMLVDARHAVGGRPILVAGPQVGFFAPAILHEIVLRGPGIAVRGAAVPGAGYPIAGRGEDFSYSVTTAQGDNTDIFAERLCEPGGARPTTASQHYVRRGACIPLAVQRRPLRWSPGPADLVPGGRTTPYAATIRIARSVHGPIVARGRVAGAPVAFARARASYRNEIGAALGLSQLTGGAVTDARSFQRTLAQVSGSYNWFYADTKDIAYVQSGLYPRRARGSDPDLPTWGTGRWDWRGFDPAKGTSRVLGFERLPQAVNPKRGYLVSWNQKQAPGWRSSDADWQYGPVHRSQRLERRVRTAMRSGDRKVGLGELAAIMGDAGTVDLRGQEVLPWLLRVLGDTPPPAVRPAVERLRAWVASGGHRRDADRDGTYEHAAAVAVMDRWFRPLVKAIYEPVLGRELMDAIEDVNQVDYLPVDGPDTFYNGWYAYVQKDLRTLLGRPVRGKLNRRWCGRGRLTACRATLATTLEQAVREVGPLDAVRIAPTCPEAVPQTCDQLQFTAAGAVTLPPTPWQDRGSFQQVVQAG